MKTLFELCELLGIWSALFGLWIGGGLTAFWLLGHLLGAPL